MVDSIKENENQLECLDFKTIYKMIDSLILF